MTRYITLAWYLVITELATGFAAEDLARSGRIDLADSACTHPRLGSMTKTSTPTSTTRPSSAGGYPQNHPLPDGKRAAWATLRLFIDQNERYWEPDPPDAECAIVAVAAGEIDEARLTDRTAKDDENGNVGRIVIQKAPKRVR